MNGPGPVSRRPTQSELLEAAQRFLVTARRVGSDERICYWEGRVAELSKPILPAGEVGK